MSRIKTRATLYVMGLILLLVAIFTFSIVQDKKNVLDEKTFAHRQLLKSSFDLAILDTQKGLNTLAYKIAGDRNVVDAFERGDRDALYRLALPYFTDAKEREEADLAGFIGKDGHHFLRMQDPKKFGDDITKKRPILAYAIENRQPLTSLDVTLYNVAVVTIVPVYKEKAFVGILQVSADINRVQKRLNARAGIKSAIAFKTDRLQSLLPKADRISYHGYSLVSSNDPLFEHLPEDFTFQHSRRYRISEHDYIIAARALHNYRDETVAMMTCAFDITPDVTDYRNEIRNLLIISAISLAIIWIILHYGFNILLRRINQDAELTRQLNHKLEHQLYTDHLTSLPNRNALLRDVHSGHFYALMLMNIDNFKEINDFYGHEIGDETLLAVSSSIQEIIRTLPMQLYKMPSDEFALVLTEAASLADLETYRLKVVEHLNTKHYNLRGASIYVTLTMGMDIAFQNQRQRSLHLLPNADMALKAAKKRRLSYLLYNETMQIKQEYQNNILWSKRVKEAIEHNRFTLYFQPIIDPETGETIEYEALIRMIDADGGIVSPAYFLPAARQSRLYPYISRFVIDEVFKIAAATQMRYSINLSVDDILDESIRIYLLDKLSAFAHADRLIFELLESEGIENYNEVSKFIADVKRFGVQVAIDDFGTGYSNFAHILRLDVDILKIDGSLIRNIDTDTNAQTILLAVAEFSKRLGLKTVAEFVHSEAVYHKCRELGVNYLQGYYIAEPKPL